MAMSAEALEESAMTLRASFFGVDSITSNLASSPIARDVPEFIVPSIMRLSERATFTLFPLRSIISPETLSPSSKPLALLKLLSAEIFLLLLEFDAL